MFIFPFKIKKKWKSFGLSFLVFVIMVAWIFSGWPQIWQNPPIPSKIQEVRADITNLVVTACDVNDAADSTCFDAISADGGTSYALGRGDHIDAPFQTLSADSVNSATLYYDSWATLSGTWAIYVKDARDGTTICSVDPAPEDTGETTNSVACSVTATQLANGVWLQVNNNDTRAPEDVNLDYVRLYVDYNPPAGTLTVDIVDGSGNPVASPSMAMGAVTFSFSYQTANGTFGVSTEKIRVDNSTANPAWTLTIAANAGSTAFWDGASSDYDFNDPTADAGDGADADSLGGQMTLDPSVGTITPKSGCTNTGLTLGSSTSFSEGVTDSVTLITASASAETSCYWDLTGVDVSQTIPAEQGVDNYSINMTLTVTAS